MQTIWNHNNLTPLRIALLGGLTLELRSRANTRVSRRKIIISVANRRYDVTISFTPPLRKLAKRIENHYPGNRHGKAFGILNTEKADKSFNSLEKRKEKHKTVVKLEIVDILDHLNLRL
ncbi:uncharacterized protein LOC118506514 [Anopheles stephensi]|uniref:uncharacterized protein LOC118506514 n=1 Tax=Anopheles stephensi TaxID=30069 RepID=UPI001658A5AA|nr:uncharacterized protein LOC118506514 [Anopheles stephensi]